MDSRQHPLEGLPGFARYRRSEQISLEADALLAGWGPLASPESLSKAERFMNQYASSDDFLDFPWEKDPSLLEDLELATYHNEAIKISFIASKWLLVRASKTVETELPFISGGGPREEMRQRFTEAIRRGVRPGDEVVAMLVQGTKLWLERVEPAMVLRRARMLQAVIEEGRLRTDLE
jgi:hypothetical protein